MATEELVGPEVAEAELQRMLEALDYEADPDEKAAFAATKKAILKAIGRGHVTIDEAGIPTIHLRFPIGTLTSITFKRPTGAIVMSAGSDKDPGAINRTLAELVGQPVAIVSKMDFRSDYKIAGSLMSCFLG